MRHQADPAAAGALLATALPLVALLAVALLQPAVVDTLARVAGGAPPARPSLLVALGWYLDRLLAGAAGGFVDMTRSARRGTTYSAWLKRCGVGAVIGNYFPSGAMLIPGLAGVMEPVTLPAAFLMGYLGFKLLARLDRGGLPTSPPAAMLL